MSAKFLESVVEWRLKWQCFTSAFQLFHDSDVSDSNNCEIPILEQNIWDDKYFPPVALKITPRSRNAFEISQVAGCAFIQQHKQNEITSCESQNRTEHKNDCPATISHECYQISGLLMLSLQSQRNVVRMGSVY